MSDKKKWWKRWEFWAGIGLDILAFSPELIDLAVSSGILSDYTLLAKLGLPLGIILKALGLRRSVNKHDQMPSGLRKVGEFTNSVVKRTRRKNGN